MPTHTPPNLYTAGAVVFNTQPTTNFAIQLLQQRKAKDDALEEYYRKLPSTINEAGMRDQDRPGFMQSVQGLQQYWQQNREAIKNPRIDGGAAQYNYEKLFRDTRGIVEASKGAAKIDLELGKRKFDPNSQYIFDDPDIIQTVARHHLPVTDPGHQTVDLYTLATPPKPLEQKDWNDYWKNLPGDEKPQPTVTYKPDPSDPYSRIPVITSQYSRQQLQQIGINAADNYVRDRRLRRSFDQSHQLLNIKDLSEWKEDHDKLYTQLNTVYRQVYDKDIEHPAELHAAEALQRFSIPRVEEKPAVADWKKRFDATEARADRRAARTAAGKEAKFKAGDYVTDLAAAARSGDNAQLENVASLLYSGNTNYKFQGAQVKDGKLYISEDYYWVEPATGTIVKNPKRQVTQYSLNDPSLEEKLTAAYQKFTGSDAAAEDVPRYKKRGQATPSAAPAPAKKKKYNPSTGKFE